MLEDYINDRINEAYDYMQNDSEKALGIFDEILEIEPENIGAINGKGSTLMKLNRFDEADECFDKSLSISQNSSALLNKGIISKHENNPEKALYYYEKAYELNPNLENIVTILKNEIDEIEEVDSSDFTDEANGLIQKGIELKNENKLWDSIDCLMKAIDEDPSCESHVQELINEIKAVFEKEFIYDDGEFDISNKIDRIKMQALKALIKENNPQKALTLLDLVLEMDEYDLSTLNHKGGVLFICGEYEKAIECFDKCLYIDEGYTCALFNKALVLRMINKLPEALNCFDELLKMPQNYDKVKPYQIEILDKLHTESIT